MSEEKLEPTNTFYVSFDTKSGSGYVKGVKITIEQDVILEDETVRIDLANHPLYPQLEQYVLANRCTKGGKKG